MLFPAVLIACLSVSAQRGDRGGRGGGQNRGGNFSHQDRGGQRDGGFSQQRSNERMSPQRSAPSRDRSFNNAPNRTFSDRGNRPDFQSSRQAPSRNFPNQSLERNSNSREISRNIPDQRDRVSQPDYNRNTTVERNRNLNINRNRGYDYSRNRNYDYNRNRNYDYNINRGRSYSSGRYSSPFRYTYSYPYYGQRYTRLSFNYHVIPFGGIGYCYNAGIFYRPFGSYYQVVAPPIGISISILPFGYSSFYLGGIPYYFYGNTYYRRYDDYYQVVEPPLGAKLPALPRGAEEVFINGQRYFEDNGTYYMEEYNIENQRLYTVVGVHGVLDQDQVDRIINGTSSVNWENGGGAVYSALPSNSSKVNINGQDYYRSPDDVYYLEISDGTNIAYQVVSK